MILCKKISQHKVKSYSYYVHQFLRKKCHKKWNHDCKQKQSLLLNLCNVFDILTSRTQKIGRWPLFLNLIFTDIPLINNQGKFKEISSTSFIVSYLLKNLNIKKKMIPKSWLV